MSKRRNHDAAFKVRVALEAVKGERTVSELAAEYGVYPMMIHQWKRSLMEGAAGIFNTLNKGRHTLERPGFRKVDSGAGGFRKVDSLDSAKESSLARS